MNKANVAKRFLLILLFIFTIFGFSFYISSLDIKYSREIDEIKTEMELLKNVEEPTIIVKEEKNITKTSDLTNDSNYQNQKDVEEIIKSQGYQTKKQVENAVTSKDYATNAYVDKEVEDLDKKINKLSSEFSSELDNNVKEVFDVIYPVGSTFISKTKTPPAYGTWELMEEGRFIEATEADEEGGEKVEAGLPNIIGAADIWWGDNTCSTPVFKPGNLTNAFFASKKSGNISLTSAESGRSGSAYNHIINIDASKGETKEDGTTVKSNDDYHVFGKSDTVQPKSQKMYIYIRVE